MAFIEMSSCCDVNMHGKFLTVIIIIILLIIAEVNVFVLTILIELFSCCEVNHAWQVVKSF